MKLSDTTLSMLKSFSSINSSIVFRQGSQLMVTSPESTIQVEVEIPESLPMDFGIYDLPNLLNNLTVMTSPEIEVGPKNLDIKDSDGINFTYGYCSEELIIHPKEPMLLEDPDVTFSLSEKILSKVLKIAAMNQFGTLSMVGSKGKISLKVHDHKNKDSNVGNIEVSDFVGDDFTIDFKTELLKMLIMDYTVKIKLDGFALFENTNKNYKYFVASELT